MKIFVSHALSDKDLIKSVKNTLEPHGITLYIAEHYVDFEKTISAKIEKMIEDCDVALILLTENGFNSKFVHQEIGYVKRARKPILQVVQLGIENQITGFTYGRGFLLFDPTQPETVLEKIKTSLINFWKQKQKKIEEIKNAQIASKLKDDIQRIKAESEKNSNEIKAGLGVLAGILALAFIANSK